MNRLSIILLSTAMAVAGGITAAAAAVPTLDAAASAQWQKLLAVQVNAHAVHFNDRKLPAVASNSFQRLMLWHQIALDTTAIDHTPISAGETRVFGEQLGPHRASRAMAIIHIAMFDAVNAISQQFQSYAGVAPVSGDVSVDFAIAKAAHDTLIWLYPSQASRIDALYDLDCVRISATAAGQASGVALGQAAAAAIIALRTNDGSNYTEPTVGVNFTPIGGLGHWTPDPVTGNTTALGAYWGSVKPFVVTSSSQFLPPPPPAINSPVYATNYQQVKELGGDPANGTPTKRTAAETLHGIFWTYDGTPALCAPPRLYNQVATTVAATGANPALAQLPNMAQYLAVVNTAMADAGITAWQAKYQYQYWRPVTGIRNADSKGVPGRGDPTWYPLGGQATNTHGPNFTPPFPAYPSGHATFGGALFESMRNYFPEKTQFTFVSDEFDGQNLNISGQVQPRRPLTFPTLTAAELDNASSRLWVGVHWQFDANAGVAAGEKIGDYVVAHAFQPTTPAARTPAIR